MSQRAYCPEVQAVVNFRAVTETVIRANDGLATLVNVFEVDAAHAAP